MRNVSYEAFFQQNQEKIEDLEQKTGLLTDYKILQRAKISSKR
jgi:hypothetical protein